MSKNFTGTARVSVQFLKRCQDSIVAVFATSNFSNIQTGLCDWVEFFVSPICESVSVVVYSTWNWAVSGYSLTKCIELCHWGSSFYMI